MIVTHKGSFEVM